MYLGGFRLKKGHANRSDCVPSNSFDGGAERVGVPFPSSSLSPLSDCSVLFLPSLVGTIDALAFSTFVAPRLAVVVEFDDG
jgi:hypothetical protein